MKKSSLKGMMSRVIIYSITVLLSSLFCWREADAQVRAKTVCLTVTDGFSAPLYGVYVVDTRNRLLVTTTDEEGQCKVLLKGFLAKDTLEFSCLGFYAKRMADKLLLFKKEVFYWRRWQQRGFVLGIY